jgi:type II secretory pathway component PulC
VIAGPWLWPRDLLTQAPQAPTSSPQAIIQPEALPASPATEPTAPILATAPAQEEPDLILKGVLVGEDATRSRALIAHGEANARLYKMDDKLPDGSVLKTVSRNSIEIEKDGAVSTLVLVRAQGNEGSESPAEEPAPVPAISAETGQPGGSNTEQPETPPTAPLPPATPEGEGAA